MSGFLCFSAILIGLVIGAGGVGNIPMLFRFFIAAICLASGVIGIFLTLHARKTFHIDISGVGQIRLREDIDLTASCLQVNELSGQSDGKVVQLLADSTLWPGFMLLRLRSEDGQVNAVPVLRDCLSADSFRALALVCRWIAAKNMRAKDGPA